MSFLKVFREFNPGSSFLAVIKPTIFHWSATRLEGEYSGIINFMLSCSFFNSRPSFMLVLELISVVSGDGDGEQNKQRFSNLHQPHKRTKMSHLRHNKRIAPSIRTLLHLPILRLYSSSSYS